MRLFAILFLVVIFKQVVFAQKEQAITKAASRENLEELTKSVYKYPSFTKGKIISKDSSEVEASLNYNKILGKILYIDRIGKAVPLENLQSIEKIIIATDTFYLYNNDFVEKYTHFANVNLYINQTISYIIKEKNEYNGMQDPSSTGTKLQYSYEEPKIEDLTIEQNSLFQLDNKYFLADQSMNFCVATKKTAHDLFANHKDELKTFMQAHQVNFNNAGQIQKLLEYMNNL